MENTTHQVDIYSDNFHRLLDVVPDLLTTKSHADLHVDESVMEMHILDRIPGKVIITLSKRFEYAFGLEVCSPHLIIMVLVELQTAEVLTYQDTYEFTALYNDDAQVVEPKERYKLNNFLHTWLGELIEQGHVIRQR